MGRMKVVLVASACLALVGCAKAAKNDDARSEAASNVSAVTSAAAAAAVPAKASARTKLTCRELLKQMEESSKSLKFEVKTTPGSWGQVPPALQKLPPGAEHCGAVDVVDQAVIASGMAGKDLETFYGPLFAQLGCQPLHCEDVSSGNLVQTRCNCKSADYFGSVTTDTGAESYILSVMSRGRKK